RVRWPAWCGGWLHGTWAWLGSHLKESFGADEPQGAENASIPRSAVAWRGKRDPTRARAREWGRILVRPRPRRKRAAARTPPRARVAAARPLRYGPSRPWTAPASTAPAPKRG